MEDVIDVDGMRADGKRLLKSVGGALSERALKRTLLSAFIRGLDS